MNIELSSGKTFSSVSTDILKEKLQLLKSGEDFLILSSGDNYIQCAVSGSSLLFEYQDESGHYSGGSTLSFETGEEILVLYLKNDSSWKNLAKWESEEGPETDDSLSAFRRSDSESSASGSATATMEKDSDEPFSVGGLMNTIKKTAKKEVKRAVEKKTSGLVKDVFRKFTK